MIPALYVIAFLALVTNQAQVRPEQTPAPDFLLPAERAELKRQREVNGRVRIYEMASKRYLAEVSKSVSGEQSEGVARALQQWEKLLSASLTDVESNVRPGKKPSSVKRYEIHLRKAIVDVQGIRLKGSGVDYDTFEVWISRAEEVRKRIFHILFPE